MQTAGHANSILLSDIQRHISSGPPDRLQALYSHDDTVFEVALSGLDGSIGIHREFSESEQAEAMRCLRLSGMDGLGERRFRTLSTGQARRVLLARALAAGAPALLLLDEPFTGLDATSRRRMMELIALLMHGGVQIIGLISHRGDDILPGLTHRAVMRDGRIISTEELPPPCVGHHQTIHEHSLRQRTGGLDTGALLGDYTTFPTTSALTGAGCL